MFYAIPVRVNSIGSEDSSPDEGEEKVGEDEDDDEEDEDEDEDDARTVIYKSPFSSPGKKIFSNKESDQSPQVANIS